MSRLRLNRIADPSQPASTKGEVYLQTDNTLKFIDDAGVVHGMSQGYRLIRVVDFITTQSPYTPTAGTKALFVECIGGGGGGGSAKTTSSQASAAGGGGGGSYASAWIGAPAGSYTVTPGASAAGGTGGNAGTAGNDTTFGAAVIGKGGGAGSAGTTAGTVLALSAAGAGGVAGTGDTKFVGNDGEDGYVTSGTVAYGGAGAPGPWGGYPKTRYLIAAGTIAGVAGGNYGAGGGGGVNAGTQAAAAVGGAGAAGICRVWEFA